MKERERRMSGIPERCPFCGGYETGIYCYGMPSAEAWRADAQSHGRLMNGGCCVSSASPKCRALIAGGISGRCFTLRVRDVKLRDWLSKLKQIDFQTSGVTLLSEVTLTPDGAGEYGPGEGKGALPRGDACGVVSPHRAAAVGPSVGDGPATRLRQRGGLGGTQWELTLHFGNGRRKRTICGSNAYTPKMCSGGH